jgi:hypothetical protein
MKKIWIVLALLALTVGDFSFSSMSSGCWNSQWDGAEKRYGNWISASGCGRNGTCQQGVSAASSDVLKFKTVVKGDFAETYGTTLVLPQECEVVP